MAARLTLRRPAAATAMALAMALLGGTVLAACAAPRRGPTYPPADATPAAAGSQTDAARALVVGALTSAGRAAGDPGQPYRTAEGAWFAAAPRTVVQVTVPTESSPRFIVLYAFASAADAATAASDQATYVSRGPGKVYFPLDTRFTIRLVGSVALFFAWSPANADPRAMDVETALDTVGTAVAIPT